MHRALGGTSLDAISRCSSWVVDLVPSPKVRADRVALETWHRSKTALSTDVMASLRERSKKKKAVQKTSQLQGHHGAIVSRTLEVEPQPEREEHHQL